MEVLDNPACISSLLTGVVLDLVCSFLLPWLSERVNKRQNYT